MKKKNGDNLRKILWKEKKIIKKERKQKGWKKTLIREPRSRKIIAEI